MDRAIAAELKSCSVGASHRLAAGQGSPVLVGFAQGPAPIAEVACRVRDQQTGRMSRSNLGSMRRESTAQMAVNIGREARELRAALGRCRGDGVAEAKVTAALLAHLLVSSRELLQNLLMDTAWRPRRIEAP